MLLITQIIRSLQSQEVPPPSTYIENITSYTNQSLDDLAPQIQNALSSEGFCIFRTNTYDKCKIFMNLLINIFGNPVEQNITGLKEAIVQPLDGATRYINSRSAQPLHTDNGYNYIFPEIIALQCLQRSLEGGESLIVCLKDLLAYLYSHYGSDVELLYDPCAITYVSQSTRVSKSILFKDSNDGSGISFSTFADAFIGKTEIIENMFLSIVNFINQPSNQMQFLLQDFDILIANNHTVLHGRNSFMGQRKLIRTWYKSS